MSPRKKIESNTDDEKQPSPPWSNNAKLVAALTLIALTAFLLWKFSTLVTPLMIVFIVAYLGLPIAAFFSRILRVSWGAAVGILYALIIIISLGALTIGGVGLVQQVQSLIASVQTIVADLPAYIQTFSSQEYSILGLFTIDLAHLDLNIIGSELISYVEPVLGQTGALVGTLASSAAESIGWAIFVLTVSFFVMLESSGERRDLIKLNIPGYEQDIDRIMRELSLIWNAFLRGQFIIFFLALGVYSILLPLFGVRYALGIALLAGIAKFLPYIGPAITWTVLGLVTFFQADKPFDIPAFWYTVGVLAIILIIDQIIDSIIAPRIMAEALKVHPAAVLVAIVIGASFFGLLGVVIAAPLLATCLLLGRYTARKMFDLDPWPEDALPPPLSPESKILARLRRFARTFGWRAQK